ncbi:MAG: hypothetical protein RSE39_06170 [Oscillospiraceae bacterium]
MAESTTDKVGIDSWNEIINSGEKVSSEAKKDKNSHSKAAKYAVNSSIVVVTFTAIAMAYFKFKK